MGQEREMIERTAIEVVVDDEADEVRVTVGDVKLVMDWDEAGRLASLLKGACDEKFLPALRRFGWVP